jgi:hypothetical protein
MNTGDTKALNLHPEARYTENGQNQTLGLGVWLGRPKAEFAQHMLDESLCSSASVAVLSGSAAGRTVLGVRLRYLNEQLLEIEAQVVYPNTSFYDPDAIIPSGPDPWTEPVPAAARMSRDALTRMADHYFDASMDISLLPPHSPDCRRRQNGTLMATMGSCGVAPGDQRFQQRRYPVFDETAGVVVAVVLYRNFLGMYLFKAYGDTVQNINVIGGTASSSSGW